MAKVDENGINKASALVVVNGELPSAALLHKLVNQVGSIICTDGAAIDFRKAGFLPDIIVGDLDSLGPELRREFEKECRIVERPSQYATDFEKALDLAAEMGIVQIELVGLKGGRLDHAITNLSIICNYRQRFELQIHDDDGYGLLLHEQRRSIDLKTKVGSIVSLIPLARVTGITTSGLLYPLNEEMLEFGGRNGQSNQAIAENLQISLKGGILLVIVLNQSRD